MSERQAEQIVLVSRPNGPPTPENFRLEKVAMPALPAGGVLVRVLYLSLDPYMRGRMSDAKSYAAPVGLGGGTAGAFAKSLGPIGKATPSAISSWRPRDGGPTRPFKDPCRCASLIPS